MKKLFLSSACLLFAMAMSAQSIFVGTYNIRYRNDGDEKKGNVWATRCKVICDMINFEAPDVFGTQEVLIGQLRDLRAGLDNYDFIGVGRDDGKEAGEYSALFYKKTTSRCSTMAISGSTRHPTSRNWDGTPLA